MAHAPLARRRRDGRRVAADDAQGSAHWTADYAFSATGRPVHNEVDAVFTFEGGRIRTHTDAFDAWRWSRQARGAPGLLLGWTPWLRARVSREATAALDA